MKIQGGKEMLVKSPKAGYNLTHVQLPQLPLVSGGLGRVAVLVV